MKEFDTIARFGTQITNENNETFRHETVCSSSTQANIEIDSLLVSIDSSFFRC